MTGPLLEQPDAPVRRFTPSRLVIILLVAGMVGMWGYVVYLAFVPGRQPSPDRMADPTFAIAAETRCRAALADVATLPRAVDTPSNTRRAAVVDEANGYFTAMLDDLAMLAPATDDGDLVREWLADWRTYLADRQAYADELRTNPKARLLVSPKGREQITQHLDAFAADNHMPACATPLDV